MPRDVSATFKNIRRQFADLPARKYRAALELRRSLWEGDMMLLWILFAIWLTAAALLPLYVLVRALFRADRRHPTSAARISRRY
jgi:hypothetical protein